MRIDWKKRTRFSIRLIDTQIGEQRRRDFERRGLIDTLEDVKTPPFLSRKFLYHFFFCSPERVYEEEEESDSGSTSWGCTSTINGSNQIVLQHHYDGDGYGSAAYEESMTIYWAVVVFHQADFTSGEGL